MFNRAFQETVSQSAVLPEDNLRDFKKFVSWLYRGTVISMVLVITKLTACFVVEWMSIATLSVVDQSPAVVHLVRTGKSRPYL
jgi:hypothetical protein